MHAIKIIPNFFFFFKIYSVPSTLHTFVFSTLISTTLWMGKLGPRQKPFAQGQWQSWDLDPTSTCTLHPYSDENNSKKPPASVSSLFITCKNSPQPRKCYLVFSIRRMRKLRLWEGQQRAMVEFSLIRQCLSLHTPSCNLQSWDRQHVWPEIEDQKNPKGPLNIYKSIG